MADRRHGIPAADPDHTISGEDWYAEDLSGREYTRTAFREVDLSETSSQLGTKFIECSFRGVNFNVSTHTSAAFDNCTFTTCNFFGATFADCKFVGARFDHCSFDRLSVQGGDWSFASLPGADLRTAKFEDVRMREADLSSARCNGALLRRVDLSGALLNKAILDNCDLRGSELSAIDPWSVSLSGAVITWEQAAVLAVSMGLDVRPE